MPQWGVQGWVNGWVKVNNKHVIFPQGRPQGRGGPQTTEEKGRDGLGATERGINESATQQRLSSRNRLDRSMGKGGENGGDTTTTATSSMRCSKDPEIRAIRRFSNRKNNRRLQRSTSHSDLIREMAMAKECEAEENTDPERQQRVEREAKQGRSTTAQVSALSSKYASTQSQSGTVQHANHHLENELLSHGDQSAHSANSLRWVAGFFGAEPPDENVSEPGQPPRRQQQPPAQSVTTGKYLNETAFVQQLEQQQQHTERKHRRSSSAGTAGSDASRKLRPPSNDALSAAPQHLHLEDSLSSRQRSSNVNREELGTSSRDESIASSGSGHRGVRRVPLNGVRPGTTPDAVNGVAGPLYSSQGSIWSGQGGPSGAARLSPPCPCCEEMEGQLLALQADLEYLRGVAMRSEYLCAVCENPPLTSRRKKKHLKGSTAGGADSIALNEASQRLVEATERHKRQIEQMTRERSRWQHDMHLKLSKFSMMYKHLNEESAIRNEEDSSLESELFATQSERNALSCEVQALRAQVALHEKEKAEHKRLRSIVTQYENEGLCDADDEIRKRDVLISELSSRLERTLDTLEMERQQQRQRRQIIFPLSRTLQQNPTQAHRNPELERRQVSSESVIMSTKGGAV